MIKNIFFLTLLFNLIISEVNVLIISKDETANSVFYPYRKEMGIGDVDNISLGTSHLYRYNHYIKKTNVNFNIETVVSFDSNELSKVYNNLDAINCVFVCYNLENLDMNQNLLSEITEIFGDGIINRTISIYYNGRIKDIDYDLDNFKEIIWDAYNKVYNDDYNGNDLCEVAKNHNILNHSTLKFFHLDLLSPVGKIELALYLQKNYKKFVIENDLSLLYRFYISFIELFN